MRPFAWGSLVVLALIVAGSLWPGRRPESVRVEAPGHRAALPQQPPPAAGASRPPAIAEEAAPPEALAQWRATLPRVTVEVEVLRENDVPVDGADVLVSSGAEGIGLLEATATTDRSGRATVTTPFVRDLAVRVQKGDLHVEDWVRAPTLPVHRTRLFLGVPGLLTLHVSNTAGRPLERAAVYLDGSGPVAQTTEGGDARLDELPAGDHRIEVRAHGYVQARQAFVVKPRDETRLRLALDPAGGLEVLCRCDGEPCAGADLRLQGAFKGLGDLIDELGRCDGQGRFVRDDLPPRSIRLVGSYRQRTAEEREGEVEVTIAPGATQQIILSLEKTGRHAGWLEGTVRTHQGVPAAGATVGATCGVFDEVQTDSAGHFRLGDLPPGPCALRAWPHRDGCPFPVRCPGSCVTVQQALAPGSVDITLGDPRVACVTPADMP